MRDPQILSPLGKLNALIALGRIPLASEVPMWTMLGCVLSHRLFPAAVPSVLTDTTKSSPTGVAAPFDWLALLQCMLVTWGTNISINYANEYFDWDLDRPGQIESISREVKLRGEVDEAKRAEKAGAKGAVRAKEKEVKRELNEKIMGNTTRIIHDGTFPPWTALVLGVSVQSLLVLLMITSRAGDPDLASPGLSTRATTARSTPYKGAALWIGIISTVLSHEYIAPPLRLHYHGWGELMSAVLLSPASVIWGMTGYYTATHSSLSFSDLIPSFSSSPTSLSPYAAILPGSHRFIIDRYLLALLCIFYLLEQARILVMHIHDIKADTLGGKITLSVRIGHRRACSAYVVLNTAGLTLLGMLMARLARGDAGMLSRIAGQGGWRVIGAFSALLAYAVPIMLVVAKTLFAHDPAVLEVREAEGRGEGKGKKQEKGLIPVVPLSEPPKLVSLQVLTTPIWLGIFLGLL